MGLYWHQTLTKRVLPAGARAQISARLVLRVIWNSAWIWTRFNKVTAFPISWKCKCIYKYRSAWDCWHHRGQVSTYFCQRRNHTAQIYSSEKDQSEPFKRLSKGTVSISTSGAGVIAAWIQTRLCNWRLPGLPERPWLLTSTTLSPITFITNINTAIRSSVISLMPICLKIPPLTTSHVRRRTNQIDMELSKCLFSRYN